jgi:hypothetical protein
VVICPTFVDITYLSIALAGEESAVEDGGSADVKNGDATREN